MLRQHHQITNKEYLGAGYLNNYIVQFNQYIHHTKASIWNIGKCILFLTLLSVVLLPLFCLVFYVNEDDLTDHAN